MLEINQQTISCFCPLSDKSARGLSFEEAAASAVLKPPFLFESIPVQDNIFSR